MKTRAAISLQKDRTPPDIHICGGPPLLAPAAVFDGGDVEEGDNARVFGVALLVTETAFPVEGVAEADELARADVPVEDIAL
jgi:hypothetical protein